MQRRRPPADDTPAAPAAPTRALPPTDTLVPPPTRPAGVQLRARRSPKLIALGVLAVVVGGLGFAFLYTSGTDARQVVAVAKAVARGETITDEHLTVVEVPERFAVDTLPASRDGDLVGRTALTDLPAGAFPLASHVGDDPLPDGMARVGLRLTHGQLPVSPMPAGTQVTLVPVVDGADDAAQPASSPVPATVAVAPLLLDDGTTFVLDVHVGRDASSLVAQWSARGELAVVTVGEG